MDVRFPPEVEAQLQPLSSHRGIDAEQLVRKTVDRMLENQTRFRAGVQRGIEAANRGDFVEEEEMDARVERMLQG